MFHPAQVAMAFSRPDQLIDWLRGSGLEILLIVLAAALLGRLLNWNRVRWVARMDAREQADDSLVRSESDKYRRAVAQVVTWVVVVIVYTVAAVMVIDRLGIPLGSFVAPVTVAGVAVGFGAQSIVKDLMAGFFLVAERQYGFGDMVKLAVVGVGEPVIGTVESVSLRVTRIRTTKGEVVVTPNGGIVQVTNYSRDWARAVLDVPVPAGIDVRLVTDVLETVGEHAADDPLLGPLLLDTPTVMGVESIDVDEMQIRVVARTLPGRQFEAGRLLRASIAAAFRREGIVVPTTLATARPTSQENPDSAMETDA